MRHGVQAMDLPGVLHIALNLFAQCVERFEFALFADPFDEVDLDMPTVYIAIVIEQVNLEQKAIISLECRPIADICYAGQRLALETVHLYREYAAQRRRAP